MSGNDDYYQQKSQPTVFHELLKSNLPPRERTHSRLWQEGQTVVGAGAELPNALVVTTYHMLANPEKLTKLKTELETVMPDPETSVKWKQLEQLPYLVCNYPLIMRQFINRQEVSSHLRRSSVNFIPIYVHDLVPMKPSSLSYGISTRMPRISPDQQLKFKDWIIPCGVRHASEARLRRQF